MSDKTSAATMAAADANDPAKMVMAALAQALTGRNGDNSRRGALDVAIEHAGDKITLPERPTPMSIPKAIETLADIQEDQETEVAIQEKIRGYHYIDGLVAYNLAMAEVFGWTKAVTVHTFFGSKPPVMLDIQIGPDPIHDLKRFLMGRFKIPGVEGYIEVGTTSENEIPILYITGKVKKKFMPLVERLAEVTRTLVANKSIFKGKAFEIKFDEEGNISSEAPNFMDVSHAPMPIFSEVTENAVAANIFNVIEHSARCRELRVPLKRGVLLEGKYGTGKTMLSRRTAHLAVNNDWTFIKLTDASRIAQTIKFARRFQPCVVFMEDLDESLSGDDRTTKINQVLNTIDGIDGKNDELMVVFTSNHAANINQAMMRPGRLDAIIEITPPDAHAALRLVNLYAGDKIDAKADYSKVGEMLAGSSSAVIREVVERAKLYQIGLEAKGTHRLILSPESLEMSAQTMARQLELLSDKVPEDISPAQRHHNSLVNDTTEAVLESKEFKKIGKVVKALATNFGIEV